MPFWRGRILTGRCFSASSPRGDLPFPFFLCMKGLRALRAGFRRHGKATALIVSTAALPSSPFRKLRSRRAILSYPGRGMLYVNNQRDKSLLRHAGFSQAIHIFFSSDSSVFLKREICVPLEGDFVLFRPRSFPPSRGGRNIFRASTAIF